MSQMPKSTCCDSRPRCRRCPVRMLKEGTLPDGYTVKKKKLVRLDGSKSSSGAKGSSKRKRGKRKGGSKARAS